MEVMASWINNRKAKQAKKPVLLDIKNNSDRYT